MRPRMHESANRGEIRVFVALFVVGPAPHAPRLPARISPHPLRLVARALHLRSAHSAQALGLGARTPPPQASREQNSPHAQDELQHVRLDGGQRGRSLINLKSPTQMARAPVLQRA